MWRMSEEKNGFTVTAVAAAVAAAAAELAHQKLINPLEEYIPVASVLHLI